MTLGEIKALDSQHVIHTYNRKDLAFKKGKGMILTDVNGKEYKDFLAGIAVNALGHSHPAVVAALKEQVENLIHTSNYYYIEPQARLAEKICAHTCADRVFFANSGAEANEGAIKLAKIYHYKNGHPERIEIITLKNSFHGRTLATIASTGQKKYQQAYEPLTPSFIHVEINDIEELKRTVNHETAAVMLELVQGESGVHPIDKDYVKAVRKLCDENDIPLIIDEVQTGMGRTGKLMAYEHFDIEPDIFTMAKALGGGVPIGALCAKEKYAKYFNPGDHGSTFGGNFLATTAGNVVFDVFDKEHIVEHAHEMGEYFRAKLNEITAGKPIVKEIRGIGLMVGVELNEPIADDICKALQEKGFLIGTVAGKILRFLPPLIVSKEDIDELCDALKDLL